MRKGRSVVHKNLEDNYGAVVVANHEALAQVLEQVSEKSFFFWPNDNQLQFQLQIEFVTRSLTWAATKHSKERQICVILIERFVNRFCID